MSFSGNGAGRFQIRRIRNGSTAESLITANGPLFQDFAEPTGQHTPNWDNREEADLIPDFSRVTSYSIGNEVEFTGGIYMALVAIAATTTGSDSNDPTVGETNDLWEYEGPIGTPLVLSPQLLVNGVEVDVTSPLTRSASPVNALVTNIQWYVLVGGTAGTILTIPAIGSYEAVNTGLMGFSVSDGMLSIDRNLDDTSPSIFNTQALQDNMLHLRCRISYNITGVLDSGNNLQTLTSDSFVTIRRTLLTESSMFSRIYLTDTGVNGSSAQVWNSGFTGDKVFQADLIIGANIANDDADFDVTYQWHDSNGTIAGAVARTLTRTRAQVDTAETYFCVVTDVHTGIDYTTNSIELRDFLDPVQFVEVGTSTVDTGSNGMLQIIPYQNGAPMAGLTASNTTYSFEIRRQANATDMTGTRIAWITTSGAGGLTAANRFTSAGTSSYVADTDPALTNGIARTPHDPASGVEGATIVITDTEMGAFGAFIDYDVEFDMVANQRRIGHGIQWTRQWPIPNHQNT